MKYSFNFEALKYFLGTAYAKISLNYLGQKNNIHLSVKYWQPSHIYIKSHCEIRQGTFLDARSDKDVSIFLGNGVRIKDYVGLAAYGGEIILKDNVLIGRLSTIFGHGGVYIGNNTMIGPHTTITSTNHIAILNGIPFQNQGFTREAIRVGENVWIGANVCVLAGSNIHDNVVVAAGAVVEGELNSGFLYGGIPARPLKPLSTSKPDNNMVSYAVNWGLF